MAGSAEWLHADIWRDVPITEVPEILRQLYTPVAVLTDVVERIASLTEPQKRQCQLMKPKLDRFIVSPRDRPVPVSINEKLDGMKYEPFRRLASDKVRWSPPDIFHMSWFKLSIRNVFFGRRTFKDVLDVVGARHALNILTSCVLFERIGSDQYVQWTGPPASKKTLMPLKRPPMASKPSGSTSWSTLELRTLKKLKKYKKRTKSVISSVTEKDFRELTKIDIARIVYGASCAKRLRSQYMLGSPANAQNAAALLEKIFCKEPWKSLTSELQSLKAVLRNLLKKYKICNSDELLNEHCKVLKWDPYILSMWDLCDHWNDTKSVVAFLYAFMLRVIPDDILGTKCNWRRLLKNLSSVPTFVKHDVVTVAHFTRGIKLNHIPWLRKVQDHALRDQLMHIMVAWCVNMMLCLIRTFFYVTDTRKTKRKLLYYRRSTWNDLNNTWVARNEMMVREEKPNPVFLGKGRLLPKDSKDVRLVVKMKRDEKTALLRTAKVLIASLKDEEVEDLFTRWKKYVVAWKEAGKPKIFFVKGDIEDCFGSLNHDIILDITKRIFRRHSVSQLVLNCMRLQVLNKKRLVRTPVQILAWRTLTKPLKDTRRRSLAVKILVPLLSITPSEGKVTEIVRDYLKQFYVQLCGETYKIIRGVPQGCILSADIADVYLQELQRECLSPYVRRPTDMLLRSMDDFFFVTENKDTAEGFLKCFNDSFKKYGLWANSSKIETNLASDSSTPQRFAHYCGFAFDSETLEVFQDFDSKLEPLYCVGHRNAQQGLGLLKFLEPYSLAFSPLELDTTVNSGPRVQESVTRRVAEMADRFFCAVKQMKFVNEFYVSRVLVGMVESFLAQMAGFKNSGFVELNLDLDDLRCIFVFVFKNKTPKMYKDVLFTLKKRLLQMKKKSGHHRVKELERFAHRCLLRRAQRRIVSDSRGQSPQNGCERSPEPSCITLSSCDSLEVIDLD
ncbi:telomerase reverse transcriptase-like [Ornithodoros turicata]|uniref:telomerase reverse transcriptase-like n=1 Tax=Ornithodoros turicata TaxID=34597 RepID=UPI00313A11CB